MDATLTAILLSWRWRADVIAVVVALGGLYLAGWWRLHRRHPEAAPAWRLALYLSGLGMIGMALLSPIDPLGSLLFSCTWFSTSY